MFRFSYVTDIGKKKVNQDALLIKTARYQNSEILFAAVCDGIGGLTGGEIASSYVITGVSAWFETEYAGLRQAGKGVLDIRQSLDTCLHRLNDEINTSGQEMGTTFTGMLLDPAVNLVLVGHVGDSRLYRLYADKAEVVTSDHSVVAEEVRRGIITEESARTDSRQNQITNCIGVGESGRVYDYIIQQPDDSCTYMLCSDGFRKMVTDEEIRAYLEPENNPDGEHIRQNLKKLLELNLQRHETDNITAAAVRYIKGD